MQLGNVVISGEMINCGKKSDGSGRIRATGSSSDDH